MAAIAAAPPANKVTAGTYGGLFVVTLTTLMYEITLTRIFSVTMWYHFAFVAISVALFGMTVGALIVYLQPNRFTDAGLKEQLWRMTLLFAASIPVSFVMQLAVPFSPHWNVVSVFSVVATCFIISIPFIFSGVVVCLALTKFPENVNRLYAADLVGAALGCICFVFLLNALDGPSAVIAIGGLAAIGALFFAGDVGNTRGMWMALVVLLGLGGFALLNDYMSERRNPMLRIIWAKELPEPKHHYEVWNSHSRITVNGYTDLKITPQGWGMSPTLPPDIKVNQLAMTIDGGAGTVLTKYTGDPAETDFLRYDITNLAHYIRQDADVLVIGIGGGRDLLSALEFEQNSVTGVEINQAILDTTFGEFGEFTGHIDRDPRVTVVHDEARSYLTRTDKQYDIIQISLIDTWAASTAGAYALTENSLYTKEAWNTFLDRLKPGGVLSVSRWYDIYNDNKPLEAYRTVALGAQVLKDRGIENPRDHLIAYKGISSTVILSPDPLSASDVSTLERETERLQFDPVVTPKQAIDPVFDGLVSSDGPGATIDAVDEDISPPTDNRPYFFQMADLGSFLNGSAFQDTHVTRPALVLGVLGLAVLGLTAACIVVPLLATTKRSAHEGMFPFYTYFAGIGLGFLMVEISQLQRLSIFLGHPTYALTVVLFSVLLSSGIGSMLTERIVRPDKAFTLIGPLVVLMGIIITFGILTPSIIQRFDDDTTPVRIAVATGILMPLGLTMGMPFAIGMRAAGQRPDAPTAFLWGINGATSVCASVLAMVVALLFGISAAFWTGSAAYVMAVVSMAVIALPLLRQPSIVAEPLAMPQETGAS